MALDVVSMGIVCADVIVRPVERLPERGKLDLVPQLEMHMGGLAGVTATVLCQLGARAAFIGRVGQDGFGDYLLQTMRGHGVDVSQVARASETGTSATVVLVSGDGERTFLHHVGANALTSERDVKMDFVGQAKVLHWGGPSVTPALNGEPIGRIFKQARARAVKTSMDTCYDGSNTWMPLIVHALPHLDLVMSSLEEARMYTGKEDPMGIADCYRSYGVETVVVKLGADGLFVKDSEKAFRVPAHKVNVVDTTGAGDAACAGFLYGYTHGWPVEQSARLANAVGGLTVQVMGGAEAVKSLDQVLKFMEAPESRVLPV